MVGLHLGLTRSVPVPVIENGMFLSLLIVASMRSVAPLLICCRRGPRLVRHPLDNRAEERIRFFVLALRPDTKLLPIPSFNCFLPVPLA